MEDLAEGQKLEQQYKGAGFSDDEINQWKSKRVAQYQQAGFPDQEINKYFGVKETDTSGMRAYVDKNLNAFHESRKAADGTPQKEAASWGEYFDAGWENSVTGLSKAGHLPDTILPEHASFAGRLISNVAQLTGDVPAMLAGSMAGSMSGAAIGGAAGSVVPGVGTLGGIAAGSVLGAGAGAFAAPAAMRKLLMDHYEKGDVKDAGDFMSRLASVTWEATRGGVVGAATAGVGALAKPVAGAMGSLAAELTTMTTAGAAMEGRLPQPQEFIDGAVMLGGFHLATGGLPTKLRNIYANTGERPTEIVEAAHNDPVLKQALLSENSDLPKQASPPIEHANELDAALAGESKPPEKPPGGSEPPEKPPEPENVQKAMTAIDNQMAVKKESGDAPWYSAEGRQKIKDKIYTSLFDRLDPLSVAVKDATAGEGPDLEASKNPYILARNFPGWKGKFSSFLGGAPEDGIFSKYRNKETGGTIDFKTGKVNGEGLGKILSDIKPEDEGDFVRYAVAKRALERNDSQFKTGIKSEDAKTVIDAHGERFEEHFQRLVSYSDRLMTYARDSGLISEESFNKIKKGSKDYIPFLREQDFDEFTGKSKGQDAGLYKEMDEGSARKILNPIESIMRNTARVVKAADLNQVKMAFGDMIDDNGFGIGEKIERPTGADNEISFKRDGEMVTYKTKPELAEAIKSLNSDPGKTALWARMLMAPAGWLRTGTVLNPDFILRHGERAMFVSAVQSESGLGGVFKTPVNLAKAVYGNFAAIGDIMKNSESWQSFLRSGGAQSSIFGVEDYLGKQNIWKLNEESGNFMAKAWNAFKSPLEAMAHVSDNMSRLAEFKRAGGVTGDLNAKIEAGFRAREVTIDYMRAGAQIKAMSSFVPFMNIGIQGMDRMVRGWHQDPIGFTARAAAALTVPTLLNWAANRNDSRYKDAPSWEKDLYWLVPMNKWEPAANIADAMARPDDLRRQAKDGSWEVNNGTTLRISKPFELGLLFASVPERLLNRFADHDPRAAGELVSTLLHGALPNILPTALTPLLEQGTNKNFFTGRPVVSSHVEGMLPQYQYNEYTSPVAKQLGNIISYVPYLRDWGPKDAKLASPMVIDNYIKDWSGTLGQYALQIIAKGEQGAGIIKSPPPSPTMTLAEMPIIKAFVARYPDAKAQPIQDFYDDYEKASRLNATIASLMKSGDPTDVQAAMKLQKDNQGDMLQLADIKKSLGSLSKTVQFVNDSNMKPFEKRQLMDGAYYQMSQIAKTGNKIIDSYREQLNARK